MSFALWNEAVRVDPPAGGISPLAWTIIVVLATAAAGAITAIWHRGNKIEDRMYSDLKACNEKRNQSEEDLLGLMKVLRVQMEESKKGRKG